VQPPQAGRPGEGEGELLLGADMGELLLLISGTQSQMLDD